MKNIFAWLQISCQEDTNQDSSIFIAMARQLNIQEKTAKAVFATCFPYFIRFLADRNSPCSMVHSFPEEYCIEHAYSVLGQHIYITLAKVSVSFNNPFGSNKD